MFAMALALLCSVFVSAFLVIVVFLCARIWNDQKKEIAFLKEVVAKHEERAAEINESWGRDFDSAYDSGFDDGLQAVREAVDVALNNPAEEAN